MPYITTGERIGYDRGKVEGQEEKAIAISLNMLKDNLPLETIAQLEKCVDEVGRRPIGFGIF